MSNMLTLKVYDIDYSFILKNYLDERLWDKEWTIFIYKKFNVILRLYSIDVETKRIWFRVYIDDNNGDSSKVSGNRFWNIFDYSLNIDNIGILKKMLNSTIFKLIQDIEKEAYITITDEYKEMTTMEINEKDKLTKIAEDFLDAENVTNDEIRQAYIDYYVDNNENVYQLKNNYIDAMRYKILTDFYIAFLDATKDKERLKLIKQKIGKNQFDKILSDIEDYKSYIETEEYIDNMKENLEEV